VNLPAFFFINEMITVASARISAAQHGADGVPVRKKMTMAQVTEDDTTVGDNIHRFPSLPPEPPQRSRRRGKDRRAAARQAKKRSKINADRDAGQIKDAPPSPHVDAPPIAPDVTPARDSVTLPSHAAGHGASVAGVHVSPKARGIDLGAYVAAIALAGAAAFFSIKGMVVIFPGSPLAVVGMAVAMEGAKLVTAGWLARRWRTTAWVWRGILVALVFGLAVINAAGVYAQLVAAHVGERGAATSRLEAQTADIEAKIDVQAHKVTDLDRRLGQIDTTIEEAAKRGRTKTALDAMEGQKKARGALVDERNREAGTLAALKAERASLSARGKQIETEAAPIRYVADLFGIDTDSERAIRWLIALMVLCCDPLAISITAAASARRSTTA
jgi:hypothetical protein